MHELKKYLRDSLFILFVSIFLPLFTIASIIFLIKLATYTAVIQLSILDMGKLYLYTLPEILFYIFPLSFFVAATLTLFKLSNDNEIVVIFSLGVKPRLIISAFLKPALFLSIILILNFLFVFPHAKVLYKNFITYKTSQAKFNLSASKYGNRLGNWLLYIGKENENKTYSDVVLFNIKKTEEILIAAKKAELVNESGILRLKLSNGEGYNYSKEKFTQINFETMYINDSVQTDLREYKSAYKYWLNPDKHKKFIINTLLSVFPIISLFLALSIGIVHTRHQKAKVYLYLFAGVLTYHALTIGLAQHMGFYSIAVLIIVWLITTYIMYQRNILSKF
jgi:lipopolysaccharide export system permease protein